VSEYLTPEEDTIGRPIEEDPESAREDVGLEPEEGEKPEDAPLERERATES
jgi:hypothetical protein